MVEGRRKTRRDNERNEKEKRTVQRKDWKGKEGERKEKKEVEMEEWEGTLVVRSSMEAVAIIVESPPPHLITSQINNGGRTMNG